MGVLAQIVEMDQERDRKTCIQLDLKVTGANRELAQWLIDHPRYSQRAVASWLGCDGSRIFHLRKWASRGFSGLPFDSKNKPDARSSHSGDAARHQSEETKKKLRSLPKKREVLFTPKTTGVGRDLSM